MRRAWSTGSVLAALTAGGCTHAPHAAVVPETVVPLAPPDWRDTATPADVARIDALAAAWQRAIASIPSRMRARLTGEGPLLQPDAALDAPTLTPGSYRCRLIRLGGRRGLISYKPDFCYIDNSERRLSFTKQTGQNLPGGWLFADGDRRMVFLGTKRPPDASIAPPYGEVVARDVAGVVERVGPFRWRLVLPQAEGTGGLDIYELTPVLPSAPG